MDRWVNIRNNKIALFNVKSAARALRELKIPYSDEVLVQDKEIDQQVQYKLNLDNSREISGRKNQ